MARTRKRGRPPLLKAQRKSNLMPHFRVRDDQLRSWRTAWGMASDRAEREGRIYTFSDWIRDACDLATKVRLPR